MNAGAGCGERALIRPPKKTLVEMCLILESKYLKDATIHPCHSFLSARAFLPLQKRKKRLPIDKIGR